MSDKLRHIHIANKDARSLLECGLLIPEDCFPAFTRPGNMFPGSWCLLGIVILVHKEQKRIVKFPLGIRISIKGLWDNIIQLIKIVKAISKRE